MADASYIIIIIQNCCYALILLLTFIYSSLILLIRRFRHRNNMFILNICFSIIGISVYFVVYFTMAYFDIRRLYAPHMCLVLFGAYNIANIGIPFSFVTFTIHRYCSIVHNTKPFFKTKQWIVICIGSQWIGELVSSLPFMLRQQSVCSNEIWMRFYTFITAVFVPIFINIVLNVLIFNYVRSSTRRVQPQIISTNTNSNNNQQPRISRRDISLLRQMTLMFSMFIVGWTPAYAVIAIGPYITVDPLLLRYLVTVDEVALLLIIINLFLCNHQIKQYLMNKIRQCIRC